MSPAGTGRTAPPIARIGAACFSAAVMLAVAATTVGTRAATVPPPFQFNVLSVKSLTTGATTVAPGEYAVITFSVTNPSTGAAYDIKTDPAFTTGGGVSRLFLQIAWNTRDFTNTDSRANTIGTRGAAMPIPVNALAPAVVPNGDGTFTATAPLPVPVTASGTGQVALEGHPAGQDATGAWTVRVPVRSAFRTFLISGTAVVPRRAVVSPRKCQSCHKSDGSGAAPQLTLHGNNRTEETQVCVMCHNPNNTDVVYRLSTDPKVQLGRYALPEQALDFKSLVHGIHASTTGFRTRPLVAIGFNHTVFDAGTLEEYPGKLRNCVTCHEDDGRRGTFELPLKAGVLGTTFDTRSISPTGTIAIDMDPANDRKVSPTAAVCSSCHDEGEEIDHMVREGGASFDTTQLALDQGLVVERCVRCHGPGRDRSVRKVHEIRTR